MQRIATAVWKGGPRTGTGTINSSSGTLNQLPFAASYSVDEHPCTNPCELLAAAHASCVTLAVIQELADAGQVPQSVHTDAILFMDESAGMLRASRSYLDVRIQGTDMSREDANRTVTKVLESCPITQVLRASVEITTRVDIVPPSLLPPDASVRAH